MIHSLIPPFFSLGGGALKYNSVHMRDKKNVWKGYFFRRKVRNAHDVLRVPKTGFLEEKGTSEMWFSHEKGTIFSQSFLHDLYVREAFKKLITSIHNLIIRVCKIFFKKTCKGYFVNKKLFRVTFSSMWTRLGGDFHQGVKTRFGGFWRNFDACVHSYIWVFCNFVWYSCLHIVSLIK